MEKIIIPKEYKDWYGKTIMITQGLQRSLHLMSLESQKNIIESLKTDFPDKKGIVPFFERLYNQYEITSLGELEIVKNDQDWIGQGNDYYFWPLNGDLLIIKSKIDLPAYHKEWYEKNFGKKNK